MSRSDVPQDETRRLHARVAMRPPARKQAPAELDPIAGTRLTLDESVDVRIVDAADLARWEDDGGRHRRRQIWIRTW